MFTVVDIFQNCKELQSTDFILMICFDTANFLAILYYVVFNSDNEHVLLYAWHYAKQKTQGKRSGIKC